MTIPPIAVAAARMGWHWQWNQLMNRLAPVDQDGNYQRPISQNQNAKAFTAKEISCRTSNQMPRLIIGRSCPWAHRTWLVYELRNLKKNLILLEAKVDSKAGQWKIVPAWLECESLLGLYEKCGSPPNYRATVPSLIDPGATPPNKPELLGNESAQLVKVLNKWPTAHNSPNLYPKDLEEEINNWQSLLQPSVNDGVYRCGFARTQSAYNKACKELFEALMEVEESLSKNGPWLCGKHLTLADVCLFPTLIRWEMVYMPLFGCSQEPLWSFPNLWQWRKRFFALPNVKNTCDSKAWRSDYFGALFPLRPSNIIPAGPDLFRMVNSKTPKM